jgi:bifunctional DNA-binding transcriptional regulator/antitoxin component of YhaV-PrlF toxin-antitoxin module
MSRMGADHLRSPMLPVSEVLVALRVQVTDDFLVAVPDEALEKLKIERGDSLLVEVRDNTIVLMPEPRDYARRLRGLHRDVWEGVDTDEYLRREREAWES